MNSKLADKPSVTDIIMASTSKKTTIAKITSGTKAKLKADDAAKDHKGALSKAKLSEKSDDLAKQIKGQGTGLGFPRQLALCRNIAGGDMAAGILLYRLFGAWIGMEKKVHRLGREWIVMSRSDWACSSGLTEAEMKNRALPRLKSDCATFIEVRSMKLKPSEPKMLGISLDPELMREALMPWDMYEALLNGLVLGAKKLPKYPYKKKTTG